MKNHSSYCVIWYFWWGCRRNLKLILEVKGSKGRLVVMTASAGTRRHREEYPLVLSASFSSCPLSVFEGASSFCSCRRHTGKKGEEFVGWTSPRHHCTFSSRLKKANVRSKAQTYTFCCHVFPHSSDPEIDRNNFFARFSIWWKRRVVYGTLETGADRLERQIISGISWNILSYLSLEDIRTRYNTDTIPSRKHSDKKDTNTWGWRRLKGIRKVRGPGACSPGVRNAWKILQMSCFCGSFVVRNGYVREKKKSQMSSGKNTLRSRV